MHAFKISEFVVLKLKKYSETEIEWSGFKLRTAELVLEFKMLKYDLAIFEKWASLSVLIMISLMLIGEVIYPVDV